MKLYIAISASQTVSNVLAGIASLRYTNRSCYGAVSHYIHSHNVPDALIVLFGTSNPRFREGSIVTHAILTDAHHNPIVDTFGGTWSGNTYTDHRGIEHELLTTVKVSALKDSI